ncbi:MAG: hypothetical protein OHK0039_16600 [Bacteroidia bacterium]
MHNPTATEHLVSAPRIAPPSVREKVAMRFLILVGLASFVWFVQWFWGEDHVAYKPLYYLLAVSLGFRLLKSLHEWYHYAHMTVPVAPTSTRTWRVDMLTTFCAGEPYDMIERTLEAMVAVTYPHENYLCDEANDPYLIDLCARLGVHHVYRGPQKPDAKAGNINYALIHHARGEIAIVLDPDHIPVPEFIDRVLPYFEDDKIGYVQCVQAYYNVGESFIAKGAAEQTYHFYGPMMMSMNSYETVQAIGANCAFRRTALDSIGGHAPGLSEDMHTAMRIHAAGWKSVYVPEALTRGLVPATLSAYYKQQLKWARGTFDLLVHVYPKLFRKFTFAQKLHYALLPLHFMQGVITLIDLLAPVLALVLVQAPWKIEFAELIRYSLPLVIMVQVIRQFAQRWVLEDRERSFHMVGGILLAGTWWVFIIGLVYTIFNIRVPYIPTPKEGEDSDEWRLALPNLLAALVSLAAIAYGLLRDWSPYTWFMAGFALINAQTLLLAALMGQRRSLKAFYWSLYHGPISPWRHRWRMFRQEYVHKLLQRGIVALGLALLVPVLTYQRWTHDRLAAVQAVPAHNWGHDRYLSAALAGTDTARVHRLHSHTWTWGEAPWLPHLPAGERLLLWWHLPAQPDRAAAWCDSLLAGHYDTCLHRAAAALRTDSRPVLLHPGAPGQDLTRGLSPQQFRAAWRHIADVLRQQAVAQVVWVWTPPTDGRAPAYDPGAAYVHMYGLAHPGPGQSWQSLLAALPDSLPVLVADATGQYDASDLPPQARAWYRPLADPALLPDTGQVQQTRQTQPAPAGRLHIVRQDSVYRLLVGGRPFEVRGVAYNAGSDGRDGHLPLVRRQLEMDFVRIREMGANTIWRYGPSIYDRNILAVAAEQNLMVAYGLAFDPRIDYARDHEAVGRYRRQVRKVVADHRSRSALLAWGLGGETWEALAHYVHPAYLPEVRHAFATMLEAIVQDIRALDGEHPIFLTLDQTRDLPAAVVQLGSAGYDFVGINSLGSGQDDQFDVRLDAVCAQWLPDQPYLISALGPEAASNRDAPEPDNYAKARTYAQRWQQGASLPRRLGSIAYCWRDRMDGSLTWYGLTDSEGRLKPAYFSLQQAWTGHTAGTPLADVRLFAPYKPAGYKVFFAISPNNNRQGLTYDWQVIDTQTQQPTGRLLYYENKQIAIVQLPPEVSSARVYLSISDRYGHVVTASHPLQQP